MQREDSLSQRGHPFLKNLLEDERQRLAADKAARQDELRQSIRRREAELRDDYGIYRQFERHLDALPFGQRPANERQKAALYAAWEDEQRAELAGWQETLAALQSQPIAGQQVFDAAQERLLSLLADAAREIGLLPGLPRRETSPADAAVNPVSPEPGDWMTLDQIYEWGRIDPTGKANITPRLLKDPAGKEIPVRSWADFLSQTAEGLVQEGLLTAADCPVTVDSMRGRYLIHEEPIHSTRAEFHRPWQLSNGLHLELDFSGKLIARFCKNLVEKFGQDPAQFQVWVR